MVSSHGGSYLLLVLALLAFAFHPSFLLLHELLVVAAVAALGAQTAAEGAREHVSGTDRE